MDIQTIDQQYQQLRTQDQRVAANPVMAGFGGTHTGGAHQQQGGLMGALGGFRNSGFGRATEMGAGFGIGDDLINSIL
ncbi:MAG: hypothetical protein ACYCOY_12595 [Metallibacterium sp.]